MTSTAIGRWLRAANPIGHPRGMAEAQRAAKMGAVALVIDAVVGAVGSVWHWRNPGPFQQFLMAEMERQNMAAEQVAMQEVMISYLMPMMPIAVAVILTVYLALAWVQWRQMTRALPIIFLSLLAYGMVHSAIMLSLRGEGLPVILPLPLLALTWGAMLLTTALWIAALKGSVALRSLKQQK